MRTIRFSDGTTESMFETLDEILLLQRVEYIREDDDNYYIIPPSDLTYDHPMYSVNKKTRKATWIGDITDFEANGPGEKKTRPVDFQTLKRAS